MMDPSTDIVQERQTFSVCRGNDPIHSEISRSLPGPRTAVRVPRLPLILLGLLFYFMKMLLFVHCNRMYTALHQARKS